MRRLLVLGYETDIRFPLPAPFEVGPGGLELRRVKEEVEGADYQERIKALKKKRPRVNPGYFDVLAHIQDMTSDKIHEQSWDEWDSGNLKLILESLKTALHEMYVVPAEQKERFTFIKELKKKITGSKGEKEVKDEAVESPEDPAAS